MARRTAPRGLHAHPMAPIKIRNPDVPPAAWTCWLSLFGASPALARKAWRAFRQTASYSDISAVVRLQRRRDPAAVQQFLTFMSPEKLFKVLRVLSPEGGPGPRDAEIRALENTIMHRARGPHAWR